MGASKMPWRITFTLTAQRGDTVEQLADLCVEAEGLPVSLRLLAVTAELTAALRELPNTQLVHHRIGGKDME
jgi:hypothetical protein